MIKEIRLKFEEKDFKKLKFKKDKLKRYKIIKNWEDYILKLAGIRK